MNHKNIYYLFVIICMVSCEPGFSTCDCFDEPDYAFGFKIDIKKYDSSLTYHEILYNRDSLGKIKEYQLKIYTSDTSFYLDHLNWSGNGTEKDSILYYTIWSPSEVPKIHKVTIEIPRIKLYHKLSDFYLEGKFSKGSCACFTPTKKTVVLDDSITVNQMTTGIKF